MEIVNGRLQVGEAEEVQKEGSWSATGYRICHDGTVRLT
jgi:hypothetical protein